MANRKVKAPSAAPTALGAGGDGSGTKTPNSAYHPPRPPGKRPVVRAMEQGGQPFVVTGQIAKTLLALLEAGPNGVTALELASWAYRLSNYVIALRHKHGLMIDLIWEAHDGGRHGRYVLRSPVTIIEISSN